MQRKSHGPSTPDQAAAKRQQSPGPFRANGPAHRFASPGALTCTFLFFSLYNILGQHDRPAKPAAKVQLEELRQHMLDVLRAAGLDVRCNDLFTRIRYALTAESLWYARSDVMYALASEIGEQRARAHIIEISARFAALLPHARHAHRIRRRH